MKFLCDRCKTRYSIGDERVRGKILKIRCKNCANVITVREGMSDLDAADPAGARRRGTTQAVPLVTAAQAVAAPRPNAPTKPPAALEEEWYVSLDGEQEGPYSLVEAQRWVAGKAHDADLHCWSEGFDDWLPVDKVSHFRGLRRAPAPPTAPPPLPRAARGPARVTSRPAEDEPKPLFAATMAALEKNAPATSSSALGLPARLPSRPTGGPGRPAGTPAGGERAMPGATPAQTRTNGSHAPTRMPSIPGPSTTGTSSGSSGRPVPAFDGSESSTQLESEPFDDELATAAEPVASKRSAAADPFASATDAGSTSPQLPSSKGDAALTSPRMPSSAIAAASASAPLTEDTDHDDDELSIGEVSRVVNLADLRPPGPRQPGPRAATAASLRTGPIAPIGGARPGSILGGTAQVARLDGPLLAPGAGALGEGAQGLAPAAAPAAAAHRRHLFALIGVAGLLLAGVTVAVVLLVLDRDGSTDLGLGRGQTIDTTRPDDPLRPAGPGSADATPNVMPNPFLPPKNTGGTTTKPKITTPTRDPVPLPGGDRIGGEEVEAMARTQSAATQRCYMRAQRGAEAIIIGDVKKIQVTLTILPEGAVSTVGLSAHETTSLGKCLISAIKAWKFRASPGGMYRFSLVFGQG